MEIALKYDPQTNSLQQMGAKSVQHGTSFSFASNTGSLETQFSGDSPDEQDLPPQKRQAAHSYAASKPGKYKFDCFINGQKMNVGGELEVLPGK